MPSKFYWHTATTTDTGTLPAAGTTVKSSAYDVTGPTGWDTNRSMDSVLGVSQTSAVFTNPADLNLHGCAFLRFCSAPIAAQTIAAQVITVSLARAESNLNSNFNAAVTTVVIWRPSNGSVVGRPTENLAVLEQTSAGTEEAGTAATASSTSVTAQDGDIIVIEVGRSSNVQDMGTAYTNTIYYDGTTEASATSCASFIQFATAIVMSTAEISINVRQAVKRASIY